MSDFIDTDEFAAPRWMDELTDPAPARTTIPQNYCPDVTDHVAHTVTFETSDYAFRCPGRYTPSAHRMPHPSPAVPSDPFTGIDEATEFDATLPAVS